MCLTSIILMQKKRRKGKRNLPGFFHAEHTNVPLSITRLALNSWHCFKEKKTHHIWVVFICLFVSLSSLYIQVIFMSYSPQPRWLETCLILEENCNSYAESLGSRSWGLPKRIKNHDMSWLIILKHQKKNHRTRCDSFLLCLNLQRRMSLLIIMESPFVPSVHFLTNQSVK